MTDKTHSAELAPFEENAGPLDHLTFAELAAVATSEAGYFTVPGFANIEAGDLYGVPFAITGFRWQSPTADKSRPTGFRDYVTLECTMGDHDAINEQLKLGRIVRGVGVNSRVLDSFEQLGYTPGERFIINDGSTGIARQVTELLWRNGLIRVLPDINAWDPADREPLSLPSASWDWYDPRQIWVKSDGTVLPYITRQLSGRAIIMMVRRGTRGSWFSNEFTGPEGAVTNYL